MDDRIDHFGDLVKAYYDIEELGDPSAVTPARTHSSAVLLTTLVKFEVICRRLSFPSFAYTKRRSCITIEFTSPPPFHSLLRRAMPGTSIPLYS